MKVAYVFSPGDLRINELEAPCPGRRARAIGCRASSVPEASFLGRTPFVGDLVR